MTATGQEIAHGEKQFNILFVISTLYLGGAQKVASILANALSERYRVTVAYCFDSGRSHPLTASCAVRKLPDFDRNAGILEKGGMVRKQIRALQDLKRELDIDVAVSLGNLANIINAMSKGREKVVCCERGNPQKSLGRLFFLARLAYRRADTVVFQSEKVRDLFGREVREKSCILKNPVDIPEPAYAGRDKKIVALGRLETQKNYALMIRSFARFHERFPAYRLVIFGDGSLKDDLRQLIRSLRLTESVLLEENDPNVHERIRDAEMFVLSSDFEGLSNALLECMAMGIACISTKCEGSVDVIRHGENGLLADVGDEDALTRAMCTLAGDPALRGKLEQQAMRDLRDYDKDVVARDWENMIRRSLPRA